MIIVWGAEVGRGGPTNSSGGGGGSGTEFLNLEGGLGSKSGGIFIY